MEGLKYRIEQHIIYRLMYCAVKWKVLNQISLNDFKRENGVSFVGQTFSKNDPAASLRKSQDFDDYKTIFLGQR